MKVYIIACFLIFKTFTSIAYYYNPGDTLYVVALDGVNLREAPGIEGKFVKKLENGDTVIIQKTNNPKKDSSFGFQGHWVKIATLDNSKVGFFFDAFISRYPVLSKEKIDAGNSFETALINYATKVFGVKYEMQTTYETRGNYEGAHSITITELYKNCLLVKHVYWESNAIELDLPRSRDSEIYYLVWNMVKYMDKSMIDQFNPEVKGPQGERERNVMMSRSRYEWYVFYTGKIGRTGLFYESGY